MAIPTVQAVGTVNSGIANVVYTLPTHQADDILLLFIEEAETGGVTAPSGWAHIPGSPRPQGANVSGINILWLRATGAGTTNPDVADPGNHQIGFAVVVRGCAVSGNPWDFTPVGDGQGAVTSFSADGGTTVADDTLVLIGIAGNTDTLIDQWITVANTSLGGFTEREQSWTDLGNGGGVGCYTGTKAAAGATGNTTGTILASSTWTALTFALVGATRTTIKRRPVALQRAHLW